VKLRLTASLLPLLVLGVVGGHAAGNAIAGGPLGPKELFSSPGTGMWALPVLAVLAVAIAFVAGARAGGAASPSPVPFAFLPPVFFVLLEMTEAVVAHESLLTHCFAEGAFEVGLLLQVPLAFLSFALARLLLRASAVVRRVFASVAWRARLPALPAVPRPIEMRTRPRDLAVAVRRGRGPPLPGTSSA
jgi:hypothetical protein